MAKLGRKDNRGTEKPGIETDSKGKLIVKAGDGTRISMTLLEKKIEGIFSGLRRRAIPKEKMQEAYDTLAKAGFFLAVPEFERLLKEHRDIPDHEEEAARNYLYGVLVPVCLFFIRAAGRELESAIVGERKDLTYSPFSVFIYLDELRDIGQGGNYGGRRVFKEGIDLPYASLIGDGNGAFDRSYFETGGAEAFANYVNEKMQLVAEGAEFDGNGGVKVRFRKPSWEKRQA